MQQLIIQHLQGSNSNISNKSLDYVIVSACKKISNRILISELTVSISLVFILF